MNIYPIPKKLAQESLLRQLYYSEGNLCIKDEPKDIKIAGVCKQFVLISGANIDIKTNDVITTTEDLYLRSITLTGVMAESPVAHTNLYTISKVTNTTYVPLIYKDSKDFLNGELLMKIKLHGDIFFNHHYIVSINGVNGKSCIQGGSGSNVKAAIVEVGDTVGLFYQSTDNATPEEIEIFFSGWLNIEDDSLLNTTVDVSNIKFLARA